MSHPCVFCTLPETVIPSLPWGVYSNRPPDQPFSDKIFSNIQSKSCLAQFEDILSGPITCCLGEETDLQLTTTSFQVQVESDKVSREPPFLQAKLTSDSLSMTFLCTY